MLLLNCMLNSEYHFQLFFFFFFTSQNFEALLNSSFFLTLRVSLEKMISPFNEINTVKALKLKEIAFNSTI